MAGMPWGWRSLYYDSVSRNQALCIDLLREPQLHALDGASPPMHPNTPKTAHRSGGCRRGYDSACFRCLDLFISIF